MSKKLPTRDPIRDYHRRATAKRRVGSGRECSVCGENRPEALKTGSNPAICAACLRKKRGQKTMDDHHVGGESNSPVTVPVPVNDHRAELNTAQYDWPKETRENREGSPLLAAAGCVRGAADYLIYLVKKLLLWIPEMLEKLDVFLAQKLGPKWWIGTDLQKFAPKE